MNQITLSIVTALTLFFSLTSFTEARANDFRSLLSELSFSSQADSSHGQALPNPQSTASLQRMPASSGSVAAKLQAPVVNRSYGSQNESMSATSALGQMQASSGDVQANSVGHLLGRRNGGECGCGSCDACDAMPAPKKRLRLPKFGCKKGCGAGCGELIDAPCGGTCGSGCGCGNGCGHGCLHKFKNMHAEQKVCMPRNDVNLPSSTMLQTYRSDRCYTNVWDGYSRECGNNHKHIHGTCDCGTKKKRSCLSGRCGGGCGEILPPRQACNACDSCDASCDSGCCR